MKGLPPKELDIGYEEELYEHFFEKSHSSFVSTIEEEKENQIYLPKKKYKKWLSKELTGQVFFRET